MATRGIATKDKGIFRHLDQKGFTVRVREKDPRTGKDDHQREIRDEPGRPPVTREDALRLKLALLEEVRSGGRPKEQERIHFEQYAAQLLARRIGRGKLPSPGARRRWGYALKNHLLPAFGKFYVDAIDRRMIVEYLDRLCAAEWTRQLADGSTKRARYTPASINATMSILFTIMREAVVDFELERDPTMRIERLDESAHRTYTHEQPNALTLAELPRFLTALALVAGQNLALIYLGIMTGRRPCELFPLRWKGPFNDLLLDEPVPVLLIRRSRTYGPTPTDFTKTKRDLRIALPRQIVDALRAHIRELRGASMTSDLLFPSNRAEFQSLCRIQNSITAATEKAGIKKKLSPRFMRRTFQSLCDEANVDKMVRGAISGHASEKMIELYTHREDAELLGHMNKLADLMFPATTEVQ